MARHGIPVDERTKDMSLAALTCRRFGHAWFELPQGKRRRAELRLAGLSESVIKCERCTLTLVEQVDLDTWEVRSRRPEGGYPDNYLAPKGTGRVPRSAARAAHAARMRRS